MSEPASTVHDESLELLRSIDRSLRRIASASEDVSAAAKVDLMSKGWQRVIVEKKKDGRRGWLLIPPQGFTVPDLPNWDSMERRGIYLIRRDTNLSDLERDE